MTQFQTEYQKMLEQRRANLADEAIRLIQARASASQAQTAAERLQMEKRIAEYQIDDLIAATGLKSAQTRQAQENALSLMVQRDLTSAQIDQIAASIRKLNVDTELSEAQKSKVIQEVSNLAASEKLTAAQTVKVQQEAFNLAVELDQIRANIELTKARTDLTETQKKAEYVHAYKAAVDAVTSATQATKNIVSSSKEMYSMISGIMGSLSSSGIDTSSFNLNPSHAAYGVVPY